MIYVPSKDEIEENGLLSGGAGALVSGGAGGTSSGGQSASSLGGGSGLVRLGGAPSGGNGLVNINLADKTELMTITGVGEAKAEKIIDYREQNGGFKAIEDIMNIPGIKEGMFNKIKDQICVN